MTGACCVFNFFPSSVDGKHLMCLRSENASFQFLRNGARGTEKKKTSSLLAPGKSCKMLIITALLQVRKWSGERILWVREKSGHYCSRRVLAQTAKTGGGAVAGTESRFLRTRLAKDCRNFARVE